MSTTVARMTKDELQEMIGAVVEEKLVEVFRRSGRRVAAEEEGARATRPPNGRGCPRANVGSPIEEVVRRLSQDPFVATMWTARNPRVVKWPKILPRQRSVNSTGGSGSYLYLPPLWPQLTFAAACWVSTLPAVSPVSLSLAFRSWTAIFAFAFRVWVAAICFLAFVFLPVPPFGLLSMAFDLNRTLSPVQYPHGWGAPRLSTSTPARGCNWHERKTAFSFSRPLGGALPGFACRMLRSRTSSLPDSLHWYSDRADWTANIASRRADRCSLGLLEPNLELLEPIHVFGTDTKFRAFAYIGLGRLTCYSMPSTHAGSCGIILFLSLAERIGCALEAIAAGY